MFRTYILTINLRCVSYYAAYTKLANYTGQLAITMSQATAGVDVWTPHTCNATAFGAACNQPVLIGASDAEVKIKYSVKNTSVPFRTWMNGTPLEVVIRLDYHASSQVDRGWRKKNQAYPGVRLCR